MKACGITDVGLQRHENQDTFAVERGAADGQLIAVVCDGMGGENCGQIASSLAVRAFLDELHAVLRADMTTEQLREAVSFCVSKANAAVNRHAQEHTECHGMGTTLVSAVTNGSGAVICNVGDSRAYHFTREDVRLITRDHSMVAYMVERGELTQEQAKLHPGKNVITRAVGTEPEVEGDVFTCRLRRDECILLCSDGLSNEMADQEMLFEVVHGLSKSDCCQRLLHIAKNRGAPDNVTVTLAAV